MRPIPRALWLLCGCQAVLIAGVALSFPFMAVYLHRERGIPMSQVGPILSLIFLSTAISQSLGGELSDLHGRRRVMALSLWGRGLAALGLGAAVARSWPFPCVAGLHFLSSLFAGAFDPAARGWVADHCGPGERSRAYGLLRIATNVGWALGPAVGGWLAQRSYSGLFASSGIVCVACGLFLTAALDESASKRRGGDWSLSSALAAGADSRFLRLCSFVLLMSAVMGQLVISLSVFCIEFAGLSEAQVGLLFSLNGLMVVALQYSLSAWMSRRRISSGLAVGALLYAVGYFCVGFAWSLAAMAGSVAIVTLGEMIVSPGLHTLAANMAPEGMKGRYLGFLGSVHQSGYALGPLLGGLGLHYASPIWRPGHWAAVSVLALCAAVGFRSMGPRLSLEEEGLGPEPSPAERYAGLPEGRMEGA